MRDALIAFSQVLVDTYGDTSAAVAAEWYEGLREAAGIPTGFQAQLGDPVPPAAVESRIRYGAGHLWTDTPEQTLAFAENAVSGYVLQPGRDTITRSVASDPSRPRWARVPTGAKTCAFCLTMASRGAVYRTKKTASSTANGDRYHGRCDCVPTPMFTGDEYPAGYDPEGMYEQYANARDVVTPPNAPILLKPVLAEIRRQQGLA